MSVHSKIIVVYVNTVNSRGVIEENDKYIYFIYRKLIVLFIHKISFIF